MRRRYQKATLLASRRGLDDIVTTPQQPDFLNSPVFIHHAIWQANIDININTGPLLPAAAAKGGHLSFPPSPVLHDTQPNTGIDSHCSDARLGCVHTHHSPPPDTSPL